LSKIKPADEIEIYIVDINDSEGIVIISKDKASKTKTWDVLENAW
ncbi:MAG TPA: 30S ribosomal protein S1, partial [Nitrospiraceae bacterium]|nr:30S ribosomal protein S1 [Nitrospiraceae bacterium]